MWWYLRATFYREKNFGLTITGILPFFIDIVLPIRFAENKTTSSTCKM